MLSAHIYNNKFIVFNYFTCLVVWEWRIIIIIISSSRSSSSSIQPLGRNQSPVRQPVWLWYAAFWTSS